MGKKRRIKTSPKFASLRKIRFPHLFTNKEPTAEELEVAAAEAEIEPATPILDAVAEELAEEPAVQVEAPEPAVEKVPEPKEVTKPKARATSKKTTTKAKAATRKRHKSTAKK